MKWKAEQLDYDFVMAESADEVCVTLTKQQALLLYSSINMWNWRTRWYSPTQANMDMDYIQAMISDAVGRLQTGLEGECVSMAVVDVSFVNDPCSLVIEFSNGGTKTIPFEGTCLMPEPPTPIENYVKTIFPECEGGQIAFLEYDASLNLDVTKFVDITDCIPTPPPPVIETNYVKHIFPECVGGQIAYTEWDASLEFDVTKFVDITDCLPEPPTPPATGSQIGLTYYSPEVRCKVAQFMADRWRMAMGEVIDHAIAVGAMDFAQIMFMGAYMPLNQIYTASDLIVNTTVPNLTPINTWLSDIRDDDTLTCIFYDRLPVNLRVPVNFSTEIADAIQLYMPATGSFTATQINIVQGYVRYWGVHQWQNIITEALWHPDYSPTYCGTCVPIDPGVRWSAHINFANNDGDPPYVVNGATWLSGSGIYQSNAANPIIISYPSSEPIDQACIRVSVAPGDRANLRIVDIQTDITIAELSQIWNIGEPQIQLTWDGTTDPTFQLAEEGVYFYADFDDLGSPTLNFVTRAGLRAWGTTVPPGFVSGGICG